MRIIRIFFLFTFCFAFSQKQWDLDSIKLNNVDRFSVDDYGNLYLYKNKDFSLTKYDSVGKQVGKLMLTLPFKVQDVQNPLNVVLFSENAQELKMLDQNLNEIQKLHLGQHFGFVKAAYAEDLQQVWILEESEKRLIQYNFREQIKINAFPMDFSFDEILSILVYDQKLYVLREKTFAVYDFRSRKLYESEVENPVKLRRENDQIFIVGKQNIFMFNFPNEFLNAFSDKNAEIVDKNSSSYFVIKANKVYLYDQKNQYSK